LAVGRSSLPVALMNGEQLVGLLVENGLGVQHQEYDLIELRGKQDGAES
jgi:hypothetical protein